MDIPGFIYMVDILVLACWIPECNRWILRASYCRYSVDIPDFIGWIPFCGNHFSLEALEEQFLIVLCALLAAGQCQKSLDAPQPPLVEVPSEPSPMPAALPAVIAETTISHASVPRPVLTVPRRVDAVVDIPFTPLEMPSAGVEEVTAEYNIPQPIVGVPGPVIQEKPVLFNVPQPIIHVPRPIVRHRPILYSVPYGLKLQKPILRHNRIFYDVPEAHITKSGYGAH